MPAVPKSQDFQSDQWERGRYEKWIPNGLRTCYFQWTDRRRGFLERLWAAVSTMTYWQPKTGSSSILYGNALRPEVTREDKNINYRFWTMNGNTRPVLQAWFPIYNSTFKIQSIKKRRKSRSIQRWSDTIHSYVSGKEKGYEVRACANTGGFSPEQLKTNEENAYKLGAVKYIILT